MVGTQGVDRRKRALSFECEGVEVARCKFILYEGPRSDPNLGDMPYGQLDILALEVAVDEQRHGIGRRALLAIRDMHPLPRLMMQRREGSGTEWDGYGTSRGRDFFQKGLPIPNSRYGAPNGQVAIA